MTRIGEAHRRASCCAPGRQRDVDDVRAGLRSSSASGTQRGVVGRPSTSVVPSSPPVIVASKTNRCERNGPSKRRAPVR